MPFPSQQVDQDAGVGDDKDGDGGGASTGGEGGADGPHGKGQEPMGVFWREGWTYGRC